VTELGDSDDITVVVAYTNAQFRWYSEPGARCNSSCSLDRSTLYGAILNATLWTTGALKFFWIGLKHRSTRASHVTKMARKAEVPFTL